MSIPAKKKPKKVFVTIPKGKWLTHLAIAELNQRGMVYHGKMYISVLAQNTPDGKGGHALGDMRLEIDLLDWDKQKEVL